MWVMVLRMLVRTDKIIHFSRRRANFRIWMGRTVCNHHRICSQHKTICSRTALWQEWQSIWWKHQPSKIRKKHSVIWILISRQWEMLLKIGCINRWIDLSQPVQTSLTLNPPKVSVSSHFRSRHPFCKSIKISLLKISHWGSRNWKSCQMVRCLRNLGLPSSSTRAKPSLSIRHTKLCWRRHNLTMFMGSSAIQTSTSAKTSWHWDWGWRFEIGSATMSCQMA